ncbi:MAG: type II toxin-antitoxin system Phd/YefM family antitoxin [Candidatus Omnitrophica bacterium]|nr:type II toxin-antitoxin system Phd/YefM family antitoxin [Candidatus Omnitrophota bacterium]
MKTTIVNLRYKMKEVLKALDRREKISILYHGKVKGVIIPVQEKTGQRVDEHPFFGMAKSSKKAVKKIMDDLRKPR